MKVENSKRASLGRHGVELANYSVLYLCLIIIKKVSPSPQHTQKAGKILSSKFLFEFKITLGAKEVSESQMKIWTSKRFFTPPSKGRRAVSSQLHKKGKKAHRFESEFSLEQREWKTPNSHCVDKFEYCHNEIKYGLKKGTDKKGQHAWC